MVESIIVYVELLDEGTDVWRPVEADPVAPSIFQLQGPIPDEEVWRFQPGELVRCEQRQFAEGNSHLTAMERVSE